MNVGNVSQINNINSVNAEPIRKPNPSLASIASKILHQMGLLSVSADRSSGRTTVIIDNSTRVYVRRHNFYDYFYTPVYDPLFYNSGYGYGRRTTTNITNNNYYNTTTSPSPTQSSSSHKKSTKKEDLLCKLILMACMCILGGVGTLAKTMSDYTYQKELLQKVKGDLKKVEDILEESPFSEEALITQELLSAQVTILDREINKQFGYTCASALLLGGGVVTLGGALTGNPAAVAIGVGLVFGAACVAIATYCSHMRDETKNTETRDDFKRRPLQERINQLKDYVAKCPLDGEPVPAVAVGLEQPELAQAKVTTEYHPFASAPPLYKDV